MAKLLFCAFALASVLSAQTSINGVSNQNVNITSPSDGNARTLIGKLGESVSAQDYGAVPDGVMRADGAMTNAGTTLTSASASFTSADAGKYIEVIGAGPGSSSHADGAITSGSNSFTSATGSFAAADVGRHIFIPGAGASGADLYTQIATYVSATNVTLAVNAGTTVSAKTYFYGAMTLETTIASVTDSTHVVLTAAASATITSATYAYGTNNTVNVQTALDKVGQHGGGVVRLPAPPTCPSGATCGYVIAATDMSTSHNSSGIKIRYNGVSLVGDAPQTNIFCRGAWTLYATSTQFGSTPTVIRGNGLDIGNIDGPNGAAGAAPSNVTVANLHFYGMTDGATYTDNFSNTTGDGWDITHKGIELPLNATTTIANVTIANCILEEFKGEQIYSGGSPLTGIVIKNSQMLNSNGDGISVSAADMVVADNVFNNISHGGIEDGTFSSATGTNYALVRQVYQRNRFLNLPKEGIAVVGVDTGANSGTVQILDNYFDTIGLGTFGGGARIGIKVGQQGSSVPTGHVTISRNFCHDCNEMVLLQGGPDIRISYNTQVVDGFNAYDFLDVYGSNVNDTIIENNYGYVTAAATTAGRTFSQAYYLNGGYIGSAHNTWSQFIIRNDRWDWPSSPNGSLARFTTSDGIGIGVLASKNIIYQNIQCRACTATNSDTGQVSVASTATIEPVGPVVWSNGNTSTKAVTIDASKEEDGAEITVVNQSTSSITFSSDTNMSLQSTVTLTQNEWAKFQFDGSSGKFFLLRSTGSPIVP